MKKTAQAPAHLSPAAAAWWDRIVRDWDLDDSGLLILTTAAEAFDRMREAQSLVKEHGILIDDRFDQKKVNPAVLVERDSRSAMLQAIKQLNFDLEPLRDGPGRPPGGR